ncbi:hypothetical protein SLS62_011259 [Diatrype stigma]|uniref:Nuclear GTPase SLIP-GC n=1 Tax=Diatrype stigma TaxID=117547 RepID=A0AAN9YE46_9PEZI
MDTAGAQPVKREAGDETFDNPVVHRVKGEPSDEIVSPASVPPMPAMTGAPMESSSHSTSRAEGATGSHELGSPTSRDQNDQGLGSSIKPDPATTSSQSIADIPQSEMKVKAEPGTDADAGTEADPHDGPKETDYLEQLVHQQIPEVLETGVEVAIKLLDKLIEPLSHFDTEDTDEWRKIINDLKSRAKPPRTVVGVVGNTGAGKSSVINALLDEERLLPTNCLRACTASPTEISYNHSTDPGQLYRAEIEFISREDWVGELKILFSDLLDGSGQVSREATVGDSDAAVAYAKLKAVYPSKTREMLAEGSPESFANEPAVRSILGKVKELHEESASALYDRLQHYVDSKEKVTGSDHKKRNIPMEYWPLIKVVRIYTKASALSTGAVIVDLPGVQDSNAARAAVAANYQKSCTGLWIVAPITRAVDDKTAKTLLGDSFKRQLKYDGTYSAVSFICSKTDDISITEAAESLGLEEEISESWNQAEDLKDRKDALQKKVRELKEAKTAYGDNLDDCEATYDIWEELQSQLAEGKTVYAPSEKTKKRKRDGELAGSRKNRKSDVDDDSFDSDSDSSDKENSQASETRQPLDEDAIDKMLASIKQERKRIREARKALDRELGELRTEIQRVQAEREELLAESKAICIKGRNEYSRRAIRHDFAMGIKELDQENAVEEDDTAFDPDQDIRDYDEVARSLPVFCVSSRAYQKLSGRLRKDDFRSHGYLSVDDTEVPKLQEHTRKLTEAGRASHCRRFLNDLLQLVNSMKLWAANDSTRSTLTDLEKRREEMHLRKLLDDLEKGLEATVDASTNLLREALAENIYDAFDALIPEAVNKAVGTAEAWGAHRSQGGLYWATYKATVRRNGVFSGASGARDFNAELFDPISRNLANGWERTFQRRLPGILTGFASKTKNLLKDFHEAARARAMQRNTSVSALYTLGNQILAHIRTLEDLPNMLRATITELQRDASREFTPVIMEAMIRHTMFREATDTVKDQLEAMCRSVKKQMADRVEGIFDAVFRDYMSVIVGTRVDRHVKLSPAEVALRTHVNDILHRGDAMFALPSRDDGQEAGAMQGLAATPDLEGTDEDQAKDKPDLSPFATPAMGTAPSADQGADPDDILQQQIREESQQV